LTAPKIFDHMSHSSFFQSADWLNLAGDHREYLGLPFDAYIAPGEEGRMLRGIHAANKAKRKPFRLIYINGVLDFDDKTAAVKHLGVDAKTVSSWMRPGTKIQSKNWPEGLLCFRQL
jgi:hypothetical protein